ncbi:MSC_0621 family F1-like ATPase epsilon subunit [Metamycoplasma alkalescens]|uniref:Uncharacterized protein n=2 Tax=Metamycoplasma alkalescens TaxID=45363 RepID=A0A318U5E1_9BACT|nr:hypothetical protein [Metamycoplasma alkalescens]PYF43608.1 hypothetical protein BCF88_10332 [Metamycoplasma alkalescens]
MQDTTKTFQIKINFLNNKLLELKKAQLFINVDQTEEWVFVDENSILAYEKILIRIKNLETNQTFYLFLINTNIIVNENLITITTFSQKEIYFESKNFIDKTKEIKEISNQINYYLSLQTIGLNLDQYMELKILEQKLYLLDFQQKLKLIK